MARVPTSVLVSAGLALFGFGLSTQSATSMVSDPFDAVSSSLATQAIIGLKIVDVPMPTTPPMRVAFPHNPGDPTTGPGGDDDDQGEDEWS